MTPVTNNLVPLCPALPMLLMPGDLHPVMRHTFLSKALDLLENNRSIVITGPNRDNWKRNRQIGKTTAVNERLIPKLLAQGRIVDELHIQSAVYDADRPSQWNYDLLSAAVTALEYADVTVLDEVQCAMLLAPEVEMTREQNIPYEGPVLELWNKVEENLARGGKMVFISCFHPLDPFFGRCLLNSAIALYFSSPVLEFKRS